MCVCVCVCVCVCGDTELETLVCFLEGRRSFLFVCLAFFIFLIVVVCVLSVRFRTLDVRLHVQLWDAFKFRRKGCFNVMFSLLTWQLHAGIVVPIQNNGLDV